jgi:hypothetical protein
VVGEADLVEHRFAEFQKLATPRLQFLDSLQQRGVEGLGVGSTHGCTRMVEHPSMAAGGRPLRRAASKAMSQMKPAPLCSGWPHQASKSLTSHGVSDCLITCLVICFSRPCNWGTTWRGLPAHATAESLLSQVGEALSNALLQRQPAGVENEMRDENRLRSGLQRQVECEVTGSGQACYDAAKVTMSVGPPGASGLRAGPENRPPWLHHF